MRLIISLLFATLSSTAVAETIPSFSIPLDLSRSGLAATDLEVTYEIECVNAKGVKCGSMTAPSSVDPRGFLTAPPVDLASLGSSLIENATVKLTLTSQGQIICRVSAMGAKEIAEIATFTLYVLRIEPAVLDIRSNGQSIFLDPFLKTDRLRLLMRAYPTTLSGPGGPIASLQKLSPQSGYWNGNGSPVQLVDVKSFETPADYFVSSVPIAQTKQYIQFTLQFGFGSESSQYIEKHIPLSEDAMKNIGPMSFRTRP